MTKQLYEEALADVKKVKEVAVANAQRDLLEVVTPRIRDLIERELLREHSAEDRDAEGPGAPGAAQPEGELMTDLVMVAPSDAGTAAAAITPPDEEGKVTLDLDAMCGDPAGAPVAAPMMGAPMPGEEYEINLESIEALAPVLKATKTGAAKELELMVYRMGEAVEKFRKAGRLVKESVSFRSKIAKMISRVEDMYDYVQESITDPVKKSSYETKLESYFRELSKLQEPTMSQKTKKMMNEEDVTLKLTGLPDDIDLDSVGVDLITGEEGEEGGEAAPGAEGEEGGDMDLGDLDLGGDESEGEEDNMGESRRLSDDTIVEIDEKMLQRELFRMKRLREEAVPTVDGHGVGSKEFDDFGGAKDDGEPIEHDIHDQSPAKAALPLGEADEDLDEQDQLDEDDDQMDEQDDQMDEQDDLDEMSPPPAGGMQQSYMDEMDLDQVGDERTRDDFGGSATSVPSMDKDNPAARHESLKRRAAFEARLQERAKTRAASLKKEVARARSRKDLRKEAALKKEYAQVAKRFNESLDRAKKISKLMVEAKQLQKNGSRLNGGPARPAESKAEVSLRNKLAETNLINAKLAYTNKVLQSESLTARQKAKVIEQLDSARTVREAKLVYESLARTLGGTSRPVNESRDRKVLGSASRATRPASTQSLNEGFEAERWARLAGITK